MTLDEAIARLNDEHRHEFVLEQGQLAEWLRELKELRNSVGAVKLRDLKEAEALIHEILENSEGARMEGDAE